MPQRLDVMLGACFVVLGGILGALLLHRSGYLYFYQFFSPETVYWACGRGWQRPTALAPQLLAFLSYQTPSFDCTQLPADVALYPAGLFTQFELYLMASIAELWRLTSISYGNLWPLLSLLVGAYTGGCYALLRLFFPRWSASVGALVLTFSPVALSMALFVRDFSKAPFFIWPLVLLLFAARQGRLWPGLAWVALAGLVVGVGYGFRTDQIIMVPLGVLLLLVAMGPRLYVGRALAAILFVGCFVLSAAPVLLAGNGTDMGAMLMEGASDPFTSYLGLSKAPYSLGATYSDELTLSSITADLRPDDPSWDRDEPPPVYGMSQSLTDSTAYVVRRFPLIAGDMATRALKSAGWVLGFPAAMQTARLRLDPADETTASPEANSYLRGLYQLFGHSWLPPLAALGLAVFLLRIAVGRSREAWALTIVFGVLLGYTGLQFSARHFFHLEFFWVVSLLALVHGILEARRLVPVLPQFLGGAVAVVAVVAVTYLGLVALQDSSLHRALDALLAGPSKDVPLVADAGATETLFPIPLPAVYQALLDQAPDSMAGTDLPIGPQSDVRAAADRLLLTLGGSECPSAPFNVSLNYDKRQVWQPFDRTLAVTASSDPQRPTQILVSAYYRATQHLSSIGLPDNAAGCLTSVRRLTGPTLLPAVFSAILLPGWRDRPLHLGFGGFGTPPPG